MGSRGWLERYRCGEREQVWHELRQCGDRVREPDLAGDAQAVCDEMAGRARHNVELVVSRLRRQGYRFRTNDDAQDPIEPLRSPTAGAESLASWLQNRFGPVPMVLSLWLRLVGDVWLVGTHPDWPEAAAADPLVLELEGTRYPGASVRDYFTGELEAWQDQTADDPGTGGFVLPLAPDRLHKANVSGGAPYGVRDPDATAEGLFLGGVKMPFVAYLNWVFHKRWIPRTGDWHGEVEGQEGFDRWTPAAVTTRPTRGMSGHTSMVVRGVPRVREVGAVDEYSGSDG